MNALKEKLLSLTVFRNLLACPVTRAFTEYLSAEPNGERTDRYSEFVSKLYSEGFFCLGEYVRDALFSDDNVFVRLKGAGKNVPEAVEESVNRELDILKEFAEYLPEEGLSGYAAYGGNLKEEYLSRAENIRVHGYGIYAKYRMFRFDGERVLPVKNPDKTTFSDLVGYEAERGEITENTRALLCGKPAANVLLSGEAGTGKSSTVKALANELYGEGLRLVEITKDKLSLLPDLLGALSENPLKFIVFIDDLSFGASEENFNALKAALEGSVTAKSGNVAIYATSNRRHIVKERFSDREGDDVHLNDTVQELVSLSDRFGLHVTFSRPGKKEYLGIVARLAEKNGVKLKGDELFSAAERFALAKGGRSPRAAVQFIDRVLSEE
ncbi:MAG: ATP-binding protein [Clostridia bacterium]|nr:ATP-binding protein [Clostridia bacterium]